ncbi:autotransporter domain-containing protein [Peteryoungia ipomoeae]|uniref:Autotransporter outer membrane beta-barrel domain-containing protein n=1 Tax=Peteryoungia ipomoeae TaxID=1210932 RepID=A0A4S8PAJ4_9HYPH|nr:autotransporter domain-containing protein [Peteryoungia ipomoeae]THV25104.1 autotransporter outer membrane beta-barrel domain-containing protein [Peteryoungia ipomoeae]
MAVCCAALCGLSAPALSADGSFRLVTINTWGDRFKGDLTQLSNFLKNGNYDAFAWQELQTNSAYASQVPAILANQGLGNYTSTQTGDTGITTRLDSTPGTVSGGGTQGNRFAYVTLSEQNMMPETALASVHFDYRDPSNDRINEARNLTNWAKSIDGPVIVVGDFNAGDVSERGLHHVDQQKLLLRNYLKSNNSFYYQLLTEYAVDRAALDAFITANRGLTLTNAQIPDTMFAPETYPVAGNTPQTMNILKKQFMLLQNPSEREGFAPHPIKDGSTTWPSAGEDATNTWPSWDRVKIDHFIVSRPYGKWWQLADDPTDPYLGVIDEVAYSNDGKTPISDHELTAHTMKWVGPAIQKYTDSQGATDQSRLVWGEAAAVFDEKDKVFYLTRNNMRTDVYLGQIADDNGMPILTDLTLAEKKTLLDCTSTDARLRQAIIDYCIDDHSFIDETLVTDGGTVIVDEDLALGNATAELRLADGRLRIAGTAMKTLTRDISLEGTGGRLDIASAENEVLHQGVISGTGALTKEGAGELDLRGTNTYTGETRVSAGLLSVNGSIANSALTTVLDGATLGGVGTVGDLRIAKGGTLAPGNSIGTLTVNGDVTFDAGSTFRVEVDETGKTDKLAATGAIALDGELYFVPTSGNYLPATDYDILTAGAGITGTFASIGSSAAFLLPELTYGPNGVSMRLERNTTAFADITTTRNGRNVAGVVESFGIADSLYKGVVTLDAPTADFALRQLSGEIYPSLAGALAEDSRFARDAVGTHLRSLNKAAFADASWQPWITAYGAHGTTQASGVADLARNSGGVFFGLDTLAAPSTRLGFMLGYGATNMSSDGYEASADTDSLTLGLYGATALDRLRLSYGSTVAFGKVDVSRDIRFGSLSQDLSSDLDTTTWQVFGEAAYSFELSRGTIEPFAGLAHVRVHSGSFDERGGSAALSGAGFDYDATFTSLGLRASTEVMMGDTAVRLNGEAGWRHAIGDAPETALAFDRGAGFAVEGTGANRDAAFVKAGIGFDLKPGATLSLDYVGAFSADGGSHGVNAGLKVRF